MNPLKCTFIDGRIRSGAGAGVAAGAAAAGAAGVTGAAEVEGAVVVVCGEELSP
jgi:tetrahydrodipicolinate N-succinyltransferase